MEQSIGLRTFVTPARGAGDGGELSFEPETHRVPRPADHAGHRHGLQRDDGIFAVGLVVERELERGDALPFLHRGDERLPAGQAGLDLFCHAFGQGQGEILEEPCLDGILRPLPHSEPRHFLVAAYSFTASKN